MMAKVHEIIKAGSSEDPSLNEIFEKSRQELGTLKDQDEPQFLFLGTVSMKPSQFRGPSAIYFFRKGHCILMDSAEGSYAQLLDHFGGQEDIVNDVILKTRIIFITHIHGDH